MKTIKQWTIHGGDLAWAEKTFGRKQEEWVDLSTAVSPWSYPLPPVPSKIWASLPTGYDALMTIAANYYGCDLSSLVPVNGSQQAIAYIPQRVEIASVAVPLLGYKEHEWAWKKAGHHTVYYQNYQQLEALISNRQVQHVVVVNPNNPTGDLWEQWQLVHLSEQLAQYSLGYMVIDEAFMDVEPKHSAISCELSNGIILRSVGKFFGLAGIRLGFAIGNFSSKQILEMLHVLRELNQPWGINHLAIWAGEIVLKDEQWQAHQRDNIMQQQHHLQTCVQNALISNRKEVKYNSYGLLNTIMGDEATLYDIFVKAARQGILLRFDTTKIDIPKNVTKQKNRAWLRVGLPDEQQLLLLKEFFNDYCSTNTIK